jgi:formylglycine-generating enzyme required for sulfatase activity
MNILGTLSASCLVVAVLAAQHAHAAGPPSGPLTKCPPDAGIAGTVCMDKYEASVWQVPATNLTGGSNKGLITKIQKGTATLANLQAGGATQISPSSSCSPAFPATFPANGQWTAPLYAVSIPGVHPTACVTWFQAQQACGAARKRLPSNAEWQLAVAGSPDPGPDNGTTDCNTQSVFDVVDTGSRSSCKSSWGAFDMVGNVYEWVADWAPLSTTCPGWGTFSNDIQCFAGASTAANNGPGPLVRGGDFIFGTSGGPLLVRADAPPTALGGNLGFRCAR